MNTPGGNSASRCTVRDKPSFAPPRWPISRPSAHDQRDGLARESSIAPHVVGRASHEVTFGGVVSEGTLASIEAQVHPRRLEQVADTLMADLQRLEHRRDGQSQEAARPSGDGAQLLVPRQERDALVERLHLKDGRQEAIVLAAAAQPYQEPGRDVDRERAAQLLTNCSRTHGKQAHQGRPMKMGDVR